MGRACILQDTCSLFPAVLEGTLGTSPGKEKDSRLASILRAQIVSHVSLMVLLRPLASPTSYSLSQTHPPHLSQTSHIVGALINGWVGGGLGFLDPTQSGKMSVFYLSRAGKGLFAIEDESPPCDLTLKHRGKFGEVPK